MGNDVTFNRTVRVKLAPRRARAPLHTQRTMCEALGHAVRGHTALLGTLPPRRGFLAHLGGGEWEPLVEPIAFTDDDMAARGGARSSSSAAGEDATEAAAAAAAQSSHVAEVV